VQDVASETIKRTRQNHNDTVVANNLPPELNITHINLIDNSVKGLPRKTMRLLTIRYHAKAAPGPTDAENLFDQFVKMVAAYRLSKESR